MVDWFIIGRQTNDIASFYGMKQQLTQPQPATHMVVE